MPSIILLDTNAYLRLADTLHPLLNNSFCTEGVILFLIPEFQTEFDRSSRLKNKFGWVNQPEYVDNRKTNIKFHFHQRKQIELTYTYLWEHNISEGIGASPVDVRALAYGAVLNVPVITDDSQMRELADTFSIDTWGILKILKLMLECSRIDLTEIKALADYLEYNNDLPYPNFKKDLKKEFGDLWAS
jgi:hypothetical protein